MNHPFWITLLEEWCSQSRKGTGLSLPFLVGATAIHNNTVADLEYTSEIVAHIRNNNAENTYFRVARCPQVRVPVIGIWHYPPRSGYALFLDDSWGGSEEDKWNAYEWDAQNLIKREYFSRVPDGHGYAWSGFTDQDLSFIRAVSIKIYNHRTIGRT